MVRVVVWIFVLLVLGVGAATYVSTNREMAREPAAAAAPLNSPAAGESPVTAAAARTHAIAPATRPGNRDTPAEASQWTPAQLAAIRENQRKIVASCYGDLERELGLSPETANAVREVFVEHFMRDLAEHAGQPINGRTELAAYEQIVDEVAGLLNPEEEVRFADFLKSADARAQIAWLGALLKEAGLPLSEQQRRDFIRTAIRNGAYVDPRDIPATDSESGFAHEHMARSEQRNALLLESAKGILTRAQIEKVETLFREQHAAWNHSMYMSGD